MKLPWGRFLNWYWDLAFWLVDALKSLFDWFFELEMWIFKRNIKKQLPEKLKQNLKLKRFWISVEQVEHFNILSSGRWVIADYSSLMTHWQWVIDRIFKNPSLTHFCRDTQTLTIHGKIAKTCQVHWSKNSKPRWKKQNLFTDQQNPNQNQNKKECFTIITRTFFYKSDNTAPNWFYRYR